MSIYLNKLHAIKVYEGVEVESHGFLTTMLDEGECSALHPGRFGPGRRATSAHRTQEVGQTSGASLDAVETVPSLSRSTSGLFTSILI
jgi:hypothetical protein